MDEDIMNAVESLFGKDVKIVDCETTSSLQQEEVLLINGVPVKLDGISADDASAIKNALLDGQMPAVEHLNQLLITAGLAKQPIEVETSLTVKSSVTTTEEVLVSRNGEVLDERTVETKEHFNHQSHQKEVWQPLHHESALGHVLPEKALKYRTNSNSTFGSQATDTDNRAVDISGRKLNHNFSSASVMSTSSAITDCDQVIGSATTINDKSSNLSSCDSGHDDLFHSASLTAAWSRDTQADSMYCDIPSSADEADTISTSILKPKMPANHKDRSLISGTVDTLAALLSAFRAEDFEFGFVLCSRLYLPPHELLQKIIQQCQSKAALERLLSYWFKLCPYDFQNDKLQQTLKKSGGPFFESIPDSLGQLTASRQTKFQYLLGKQSSASSLGRQSSIKSLKRFATNVYKSENVSSLCSNAFELSHQLYAIEYAYLSQIRLEEFIEMLNTGIQQRCISPTKAEPQSQTIKNCINIGAYEQWFNRLSLLAATEIVKLSKKSQRAQIINFWIETALECFNTGNFNSLMAILTALNMTAISRLKKTWSKVQITKFEGLEHQMDPKLNFLNYRSTMKAAVWRSERETANKIERAIIPFFSLFLKDLYVINESCESKLSNGHINFEKCKRLGAHLESFYKWQRLDCPYEQIPKVAAYIQSAETLSEDALMKASYECEPPDCDEEKDHYKTLRAAKKAIT